MLTIDDLRALPKVACPVHAISREPTGLRVAHTGGSELFDQVVMACHSDQALAILGTTASRGQHEILSAIRYQANRAVLHTDAALLPRVAQIGMNASFRMFPDSAAAKAPVRKAPSCTLNRIERTLGLSN